MKKLIKHFTEKQKTLFLIDSIGAFTTAFLLFVIVRQFNEYFEMPKIEVAYLSAIAVFFSIYSAACYLFLRGGWTPFIRFIGVANLIYCALTIGLLIKYYHILTIMGIAYFLIEIVIICGLSYVELNVAAVNKEIKRA
ncbi:MAG: hypothetical protein K9G49_04325 [Taibaiella sp.]|nr:hypothetical protein [Taibaiella sp.]